MDGNRYRGLGGAGVLAGVAVFGFVLLKQWLLPVYGGPPPFQDGSSLAFHMLETIPLVLLGAGTYGAWLWLDESGDDLGATGALVAVAGAGIAAVAHAFEHLLFQVLHSELGYGFMGAYYLGWALLAVGLTVVGFRADASAVIGTRERALLIAVLPAGIAAAALFGTLWFRSFADGFKLAVAVVVATLGYRLRRPSEGGETAADIAPSEASR